MKLAKCISIIFISCLTCSYAQVTPHYRFPKDNYFVKEKVVRYSELEKNIKWAKRTLRDIDLSNLEQMSISFPGFKESDTTKLVDYIINAAISGKIGVYSAGYFDENRLMSTKEVENLIFPIDSIEELDPMTGEYVLRSVSADLSTDIKKMRIIQDWFWNKKNNVLKTKVVGLCPVLNAYDEEGNYMGTMPLFWIYYK